MKNLIKTVLPPGKPGGSRYAVFVCLYPAPTGRGETPLVRYDTYLYYRLKDGI